MRFRNVSDSGEWAFGNGRQCYLDGDRAIMANVATRLRTFKTECFFDRTAGVAWFDLLGSKDTTALVFEIRSQILQSYGVIRVPDVQFFLDDNRNAQIRYTVDTIYTTGLNGALSV